MSFIPRKVDANQREIIQAFEAAGWMVLDTHAMGYGFPDLIAVKPIWGNGFESLPSDYRVLFVEVKTKEGRFTKQEREFYDRYPGLVKVARCAQDVLNLIDDKERSKL